MTVGTQTTPRLTEAFIELIGYIVTFRQTVRERQPSYEDVRNTVLRLLKQSDQWVEKGYYTADDFAQARYAVCAWIDEVVLGSAWTKKGQWRPELLQKAFYRSADAGEQFFRRLNDLEIPAQDIREVYFLCLALGFKGQYCDLQDSDSLNVLKKRHLGLLFNGAFESPTVAALEGETLFPEAYAQRPLPARSVSTGHRVMWHVALAVPALLFAALFLMYQFTLSSVVDNLVKGVSR